MACCLPAQKEAAETGHLPDLAIDPRGRLPDREIDIAADIEHRDLHGPDIAFDARQPLGHLHLVAPVHAGGNRPAARALLSALEDGGGRGGERADERGKERGERPRMHDIVCQADDREGLLCTGFFVARGTDALRGLWQCVRDRAIVDGRDQLAFNELVREDARSARRRTVRAGTLPREFFGAGCGLRQPEGYDSERRFHLWEPGVELDVPEDVVVHHANWTVGVDRKLAQLELVAECVRARSANA